MENDITPGLFVNDGSFMEKFKQLQQEKQQKVASEESVTDIQSGLHSVPQSGRFIGKKTLEIRSSNDIKKSSASSSGGKLAFSLKQKTKVALPAVQLGADEEDEEKSAENASSEGSAKRQKLGQTKVPELSLGQRIDAPSPPSDLAVKNAADKLANFVAKNGRQFEDITRQKNPGDTPFKFLFDKSCSDYKYYEFRLLEEENLLKITRDTEVSHSANASSNFSKISSGSQRNHPSQHSNYQTPASALYEFSGETRSSMTSAQALPSGESSGPAASDPISRMEFYMKKAAQEERKRQPKHSKDEMPPPASLQASSKKGHHMGDFIPPEELERFLSACNGAAAQKAAEKAKIQADNVGHKLLSKMGWKEGEGLGSSSSGRADPVTAGSVKTDNLGVGAEQPGAVTAEDDIYEQYKKRMMLGYRYRPNPLNNPRKAYY